MKEKNNSVMARRNRNNRIRGSAMEKYTADFLDMDVVPYSGSNTRFGFGDIRDSLWLGECKNITPTDGCIVIKREWLDKNNERASKVSRMPFLAFMAAGTCEKYVILEAKQFMALVDKIKLIDYVATYILDRASCKSINFKIRCEGIILKNLKFNKGIAQVILRGTERPIYIMNLSFFKKILADTGLKGIREWKAE